MNLAQIVREAEASSPVLLDLAKETRAYVDELNKEIRTTSYLLHPPMLDEMGLRAALAWYVEGLQQRAGLHIHLSIDDDFPRPSRELELTIFRVIQECLSNIHRHAGSQTAYISIAGDHQQVLVEVRDEGRGISAEDLQRIRACPPLCRRSPHRITGRCRHDDPRHPAAKRRRLVRLAGTGLPTTVRTAC
jgi:signal transduction histidine kinase